MPKRTIAGTGGTVPKQRAEREPPATFTWTVEFTVTENWVADGFNLTDERAHSIICNALPYAFGHELQAKVLTAPDSKAIRRVQGYDDGR